MILPFSASVGSDNPTDTATERLLPSIRKTAREHPRDGRALLERSSMFHRKFI
jgi:hypothetical protein